MHVQNYHKMPKVSIINTLIENQRICGNVYGDGSKEKCKDDQNDTHEKGWGDVSKMKNRGLHERRMM